MRHLRVPLAIATALAGIAFAGPARVHAATTTLTCPVTFAALSAAIPTSSGSATINITNNSAAPCTVNVTDTIDIVNGVTVSIVNTSLAGNGPVQFDGGNSNELFDVSSRGSLSLTGLTLQNGSLSDFGGAIFSDGTLNVTNCTFQNNEAFDTSVGGAIASDGILTVTNSTFDSNTSDEEGGAIDSNGLATITNSTFTNNSVSDNEGVSGGAVGNESDGQMTITNSTFTDNSVFNGLFVGGGAIENSGALVVTGSTIAGNSVSDAEFGPFGGGIDNEGALTVANSTISGNSAVGGFGGGIATGFSPGQSLATIVNSTISGNTARVGGGVDTNDVVSIGNSIIAGNTFNNCGSGLACLPNQSGAVHPTSDAQHHGSAAGTRHGWNRAKNAAVFLSSTRTKVLPAGPGGSAPDINDGDGVTDLGHNLIGDESGTVFGNVHDFSAANGDVVGTSANPVNPLLGPLQDNGGPTQTMALLPGSPAIDLGLASLCLSPNVADKDQRGVARHAAARGLCDTGAFDTSAFVVTGALNSLLVGSGQPGRLGFAGSELSTFTLGYITFQDGISTLIARQPVVASHVDSCPGNGICTDAVTLSGTIGSTKGSLFTRGGTVQVIVTTQTSGKMPTRTVTSVEVKVFPPAATTALVDSTWAGPFTGNRRVVFS